MTLIGTIRTLESGALAKLIEGLLCNDVTAGHHHGRIGIGGLFLGHWADKDAVEVVLAWQGDFDGKFVLRGPFGALLFHDALHFQQVGERYCAGRGSYKKGRVGTETQQRTKLSVERVGYFFPRRVVVEEAAVGRVLDVLPEGHCA